MNRETYIGMDLGTGSIKTVLFDRNGIEIASASAEYPVYQPRNGWSEQDPEDWFDAAVCTVRSVMESSGASASDVKGIGLSGQMMGIVLLDGEGRPMRRAILWNDGRTTQACEDLRRELGDDLFLRRTLTPVRPGLSAAKIRWVMDHEPGVFRKTAHILLPKDYLRFRLTGEYATEVSDASATQLLDIPKRNWSDEILEAMGLRRSLLGTVAESHEITGCVLPDIAKILGIAPGCPVAGGASDNAAAAVGVGAVDEGSAITTIGTSGTVFAYSPEPVTDTTRSVYTFCMPVPDAWHFMGSVNACGGSLKWWRNNFYPEDRDYARIDADAESSVPGANRLIFLPYLNGEQSPHFDLACRGCFIGLSSFHSKADMSRAVLEGATYALRDILSSIRGCGIHPVSVRMCGGGSKSLFWRQLLSDVYNLPVELPDMDSSNSAALGAAILAMTGTGAYGSVREACGNIVNMRDEHYDPDPERTAVYDRVYEVFDSLYPKLKESFREIQELKMQ